MTNKILIIGPSWVGDMIMAQALFKTLKRQDPQCQIDVLAPDWCRAILQRMPEVNQSLVLPFQHGQFSLLARYHLGKSLRAAQYQKAYVLPNSWKSALIPFFAKIPRRIGWRGEMRYGLLTDLRVLDKKCFPKMVQRFVALANPQTQSSTACPVPLLQPDLANQKKALDRFHLSISQPILALCPGAAFGPSKQWPVEKYVSLAKQKQKEGWQVWLFGSKADRAITTIIASALSSHVNNLAGELELSDTVDLLALSSGVVSNDSGLMHMAAALARPLVAIYGSTTPEFTPPLGSAQLIQKKDLPCRPCFKRQCPLKHHACMQDIQVSEVRLALDEATA